MHRFVRPVIAIAWLMFLIGPLACLFAPASHIPRDDQLFGLYAAIKELLGEHSARWIFGGLWLAMNAALFWRFVLSKNPYDVGDSLDLHD
jgi:hypothetical protein